MREEAKQQLEKMKQQQKIQNEEAQFTGTLSSQQPAKHQEDKELSSGLTEIQRMRIEAEAQMKKLREEAEQAKAKLR